MQARDVDLGLETAPTEIWVAADGLSLRVRLEPPPRGVDGVITLTYTPNLNAISAAVHGVLSCPT